MRPRREDWPGAVCVVALLALGILLFQPSLFPGTDVGQYLVLAESLRTGHGYRDLMLPGTPLHAKFPPGYPAFLAVLGLIDGLQLMKWASLALTAGTTWLLWRLARHRLDTAGALAATLPFAASPLVLDYSHFLLSEALFTLLVVSALLLAEKALPGPEPGEGTGPPPASERVPSLATWTVASLFAAAAFFTRTAGLALLLALAGAALFGPGAGRVRRLVVAGGVAVGCLVGWGVYQRLASPGQPGYLQQLVMVNPYDPAAGSVGPAGVIRRAATNLWLYVSAEIPASFGAGRGRAGSVGAFALLVGVLPAAAALAGWIRGVASRVRPLEAFAALYAGLLLVWPQVWTDWRFLLPGLPAGLVLAAEGAEDLGRRFPRVGPGAAAGFLALLLVVPSAGSALRLLPERFSCRTGYREGRPCEPPAYSGFFAAARWVKENTPEGVIVANRSPAFFYYFSHHQGDLYPFSRDPETVIRGLERMGADFVVVDQLSGTTWLYLVPAIQANADRFRILWSTGDPPTAVLRFERAPRTAAAGD